MSAAALSAILAQLDAAAAPPPTEETYDLSRLRELSPAERTTLAARLVSAAQAGDLRALLTLGELDEPASVAALQAEAGRTDAAGRTARRALVRLGRGASVVQGLAADAAGGSWLERFAAVMALGQVGGPVAVGALRRALTDDDSHVRLRAFESLVEALGLAGYVKAADGTSEPRAPLKRLSLLLGSDLAPLRAQAVADLDRIAAAIASGASPDTLGLRYVPETPDAFRLQLAAAIVDESEALPVDALRSLSGHDRQAAEALFAYNLARRDPRFPAALAALGAAWTADAMRAAAADLPPGDPFRAAVDAALDALG